MKTKPTLLLLATAALAAGLAWLPARAEDPAPPPAAPATVAAPTDPTTPPAPAAATPTPVAASAEPVAAPAPTPTPAVAPAAAEPIAPIPAIEAPATPAKSPAADNTPEPTKFVERGEVVGSGATIAAGERASQAVSIIGDLTIDGEVRHDAVAIRGNMLVNGKVGHDAVVILGSSTINGRVDGTVVCVLGTVELGPKAEIGRDCVIVGGVLSNPHHRPIHGQTVVVGANSPHFDGAIAWFKRGLLEGRLLVPGLAWPWLVFGGFLLFYLLLAAMFGRGVNACAQTLEENPGKTLVASLVMIPLVPLLSLALGVITLGIGFPFIAVALMFARLFGKAAFLAFLGRAILRAFGADKPALVAPLTVLIGAGLMAVLYMVPILGFLMYTLTGWIGLGMVIYTIILKRRKEKAAYAAANPRPTAPAPTPAPVRKFSNVPASVVPAPMTMSMSMPAPTADAPSGEATPTSAETPLTSAGFVGGGTPTNETGTSAAAASGSTQVPPVLPAAGGTSWTATPSPFTAETCPRADFWARLAALIIDIVLVAVASSTLGFVHFIPFPVWFGGYAFGMWLWKGTTIGGVILNLRIVRLDGRPIDPATAGVRTVVAFLSVAAAGLGFLWCLWDDEQQTWHDKVAGTVVIRTPKGTPLV